MTHVYKTFMLRISEGTETFGSVVIISTINEYEQQLFCMIER